MKLRLWFSDEGWDDYTSWVENARMLKRINKLIADIRRNPNDPGIGKPEFLSGWLSGYASRRITDEHRLIYRVESGSLEIIQCRGHYDDK